MKIVMEFRQFINAGFGEIVFIISSQNYLAILTVDLFEWHSAFNIFLASLLTIFFPAELNLTPVSCSH